MKEIISEKYQKDKTTFVFVEDKLRFKTLQKKMYEQLVKLINQIKQMNF